MFKKIEQAIASYTEFEKLQWVSNKPIPAVGTEINVAINSIGKAKVLKYFVEHGFIGLLVQPLNPPEWYIRQNNEGEPCHVFPAEVTELQVRDDEGRANEQFYKEMLHS